MARTFPSKVSPCDFYGSDIVRPLGYFEGLSTTADIKMVHFHYTATCTSGDSRALYSHLTLAGAGGAGEAVRGRTEITAVAAGGVHGGHFGVEFGASGQASGLAVGCRSTLMIPNSALGAGTYYGGMSEIYAEGASSDISGTTNAIHAFVNAGNSTGTDTVGLVLDFVGLETGTTGGTDLVDTGPAEVTCNLKVRCRVNGTVAWLMFCTTDS